MISERFKIHFEFIWNHLEFIWHHLGSSWWCFLKIHQKWPQNRSRSPRVDGVILSTQRHGTRTMRCLTHQLIFRLTQISWARIVSMRKIKKTMPKWPQFFKIWTHGEIALMRPRGRSEGECFAPYSFLNHPTRCHHFGDPSSACRSDGISALGGCFRCRNWKFLDF